MKNRHRAIVVVTEGISRPLLLEWSKRGLLKGFAHLLNEGASGRVCSDFVPYEPPGLATAFTGRPAGEHGWFSYWRSHERDYRPRPITSADQRHPFIWQRAELHSKRFAVINIFGTHPPKPINAWLITYPTQQSLRTCHPADLLWSLSRRGLHYTHDVSVWFSGQSRHTLLPNILEADRRRMEIALMLWREGADVMILNLTCIDRLSHIYWQEIEPGSSIPITESAIFQAYSLCDSFLSRLIEESDEQTSILAFSEIGFGPLRAYYSVNDHLESADFLSRGEGAEGRKIKWNHTVAFEAVQGTHGVNINVAQRYNQGIVREEEYRAVRDKVIEALLARVNPYTGLDLFRQVLPREQVYVGEAVSEAPDIILQPADERYLPLGDPYWATHVNRSLQSGWHRRESYWTGFGPAFGKGERTDVVSVQDIAPTIFRMMGEDIPADFRGHPLT